MNRNILIAVVLPAALSFLLVFSCDWEGSSDYKGFAYDLQGTWETNEGNDDYYSGTLAIGHSTITIGGYVPNELHEIINGTGHRPFKDFTKNAPLEGYSEEGKIFIKDAGVMQEGLSYTYWEVYSQPEQKQIQLLRFNFCDSTLTAGMKLCGNNNRAAKPQM